MLRAISWGLQRFFFSRWRLSIVERLVIRGACRRRLMGNDLELSK